jgi:hypothetical protein
MHGGTVLLLAGAMPRERHSACDPAVAAAAPYCAGRQKG